MTGSTRASSVERGHRRRDDVSRVTATLRPEQVIRSVVDQTAVRLVAVTP
ncbi:hypothetical protein [Asanoa ferruginea]|nr:hypothetical protein [Asanoa ferruginea]